MLKCRKGVLKKNSSHRTKEGKSNKKPLKNNIVKIIALIGIVATITMFLYIQLFAVFEEENIVQSQEDIMFENSMPLLAVNELNDEIVSSSVIPLSLKITRGSGNTFVNLNSYTELDTQISITNSQNTICSLLELPCSEYDFYYTFDDASLVLKGPSASSSVGILVYSTINGIKLDDSFAMTGNLNSNGIIGMVGGVEDKVERANSQGFDRVYIPYGSLNESSIANFNSEFRNFEIRESLDIIDVLKEEFKSQNISLPQEEYSLDSYTQTMKFISDELCEISDNYLKIIENNNYASINISNETSEIQASLNQINNSKIANENEEFYSRGSFCYSANIGMKNLINTEELNSEEKIQEEIELLEEKISQKKREYNPQLFPRTLNSLNDIYTYLLLSNRIFETEEFLNQTKTNFNETLQLRANDNSTNNNSQINNSTNSSLDFTATIQQLSLAQERLTTVEQWEEVFGTSNTKEAQLSYNRAQEICRLYITETNVLNELMNQYSIEVFNEQIENLESQFSQNPYLCIFNGMQTKGRMNTVLVGNTMNSNDIEGLIREFQAIAQSRMEFKSQGGVPLIPYISYEYSNTLLEVGNTQSALQYVQLALSYSELNILLDDSSDSITSKDYFNSELTPFQKEKISELSFIQNMSYLFLILAGGFIIYFFKL